METLSETALNVGILRNLFLDNRQFYVTAMNFESPYHCQLSASPPSPLESAIDGAESAR
jgi:hypothetical protein